MTFKKGTKLVCIRKPNTPRGAGYNISVGSLYLAAEDSYLYDDRELIELVYNDSGEPCTHYETDCFEPAKRGS